MTAPITASIPLAPPVVEPGDAGAEPMPGFLRPRRRTPGWHWLVILLLLVTLALQVVLADRARLAADATTRPAISALCAALRCSVPAWHEPEAFMMTARDVRPLTGQPGNLQVRASIRNDARWEQPWPALKLSLSDADGRVVGSRVFSAAQYLDDPTIAATPLLPGQSAQLAFIVNDPSPGTVAFSFQFQ